MVYETFQATVTTELKKLLGDDYQFLLQKIPKNNGLILDGLCISPKGVNAAPTIYLNSYYEQYLAGISIHKIVWEIFQLYKKNSDLSHLDFSILEDFSQLKGKILYKLIHTQSNEKLLKDLPSVPYLDLSIVFYLFLEKNDFGQMTLLIRNSHLKSWKITKEELYQLASQNTPILLPPDLKSMSQVMEEMMKGRLGNDFRKELMKPLATAQEQSPMYVLSNRTGIQGSCAILYPGVLKNFANLLDKDLVILPSSIHEVLLIPYEEDISFHALSEMVTFINGQEVPVEDRLSNHVYLYSRQTDQVAIAQDSASPYLS